MQRKCQGFPSKSSQFGWAIRLFLNEKQDVRKDSGEGQIFNPAPGLSTQPGTLLTIPGPHLYSQLLSRLRHADQLSLGVCIMMAI